MLNEHAGKAWCQLVGELARVPGGPHALGLLRAAYHRMLQVSLICLFQTVGISGRLAGGWDGGEEECEASDQANTRRGSGVGRARLGLCTCVLWLRWRCVCRCIEV